MSIQILRERTGAGIADCAKAWKDSSGDIENAIILLRERGIIKAESFEGRTTKAGYIGWYTHHDGMSGAMIGLSCETDFVARMPDFRALANNIACHAIGANAQYLDAISIPSDVRELEFKLMAASISEKVPEGKREQIVTGKFMKFREQNCLIDQKYLFDEKITVQQLLMEFSSIVKEKIEITSFARIKIG